MKIGVISDTHLRAPDERLERIIECYFSDVDLLLHAGDIVDLKVLDVFAGMEFYAVSGNMDTMAVKDRLPQKQVIEIMGHRIGLIHGWGGPSGLALKLVQEFENLDCLVYGHTHQAENRIVDDVLLFNPGSATDGRISRVTSIGILDVEEKITGTIIPLEKF